LIAWPRSAQLVTAFLLGIAATLLTVRVMGSLRSGSRPTELQRGQALTYRIDLNRATRAELLQLPGVGESLAGRIEERRQQRPFGRVEELIEVPGIGVTTLERLRPWVCVHVDEEDEGESAPVQRPTPAVKKAPVGKGMNGGSPRSPGKKETTLAGPININRAGADELQKLPGIGPKLSQRIVDERSKAPFKSVDDLRRVPGIGPKTLEKLRPHITVGGSPVSVAIVH
jgi:competence protein ComEA